MLNQCRIPRELTHEAARFVCLDLVVDNINALFARLRGLLFEPPSPQGWDALCALFDRLPAEHVDMALLYAQPHLERWPQSMRIPPLRWRRAHQRDHLPAGWPLVCACHVVLHQYGPNKIQCISALTTLLGKDDNPGAISLYCWQSAFVALEAVGLNRGFKVHQRLTELGCRSQITSTLPEGIDRLEVPFHARQAS